VLIDEPAEGYFQIRLRKAGPWVPVRVWLEDGERDPETWELLSDQRWLGEWAPRTDSARFYPINPMAFLNRLHPISKDDFQWLLILRTFPPTLRTSRRGSRKR
jgi:hypothetical protein